MGTGAAFVLMAALVGRAGATRGGVAIYFIPIVAMVLGITFRSEVIHPLQWAGTAVVLFSAWLTTRHEPPIKATPHRHQLTHRIRYALSTWALVRAARLA